MTTRTAPALRIELRKTSQERHVLAIIRASGQREEVDCETRSYLVHDLLHYAVEAEAGLDDGFWGNLAAGRTLVDMNDRTGKALAGAIPDLLIIEQVVGALSGVVKHSLRKDSERSDAPERLLKQTPAGQVVAGLRDYVAAQGKDLPAWVSEELVVAVKERLRKLLGRWRATPYRSTMELAWPAGSR